MVESCAQAAFHGDVAGLQAMLDTAAAAGSPAIADVEGLPEALDGKQPAGSYASPGDVAGLAAAVAAELDGKQDAGSYAAFVHGHALADITGLIAALAGKQDAGSYAAAVHTHDDRYYTEGETDTLLAAKLASSHAGSGGTAHANAVAAGAAGFMTGADKSKLDGIAAAATANATDAALRDRSTHTGSQSLDTTADSATRLAMTAAERTKLTGVATAATANATDAALRDRTTHTGSQSLDTTADSATRLAMTAAERTKLGAIATGATANATDAALSAPYRTLLDSSGSHIAGKVAGTYGLGQGDPIAVSGTGILYPLNIIWLDPADYPAIGALTAKLRLLTGLFCNDVAPTGNFTFGLYPVTRPGTSGGAGLNIYTLGTVVAGSTALFTAPAADSSGHAASADFAVPAAGFYAIGCITTGTIATSAHVHLSAALQIHHA